ncbi:MAG TPA: hypothetical protein VM008_14795 [Phycisphaerae bacterium]|nr:hypothetical protein [Phycisphaerae bacterium]
MDAGSLLVFMFLSAGIALIVYLIAADRKRFLARFDLSSWRDHHYLRRLPNFLQSMHDNHFRSAWPRRHNAVSSFIFCNRARRLLRASSPASRHLFLRQHIALFALLELLKPYIDDFLLHERQRIVSARIVEMSDTVDRDRLAAYLDSIRLHRAKFYSSISIYDRKLIAAMVNRKFLPTLRIAHAVFQEHGFSLLPEFDTLRRWESLEGPDLAQELPRNLVEIKRLPAAARLKTFNYGAITPSDDFPAG